MTKIKLKFKPWRKQKMENKTEKKCPKCYGAGWWPIGGLSPIGPMDAEEWGDLVIKCPWCFAGTKKTGERYNSLKKIKDREEKEKNESS